jgi:hypothetical protein
MATSDDNVVRLVSVRSSPESWPEPEAEAWRLATLAAMPELQYERVRRSAARDLGCRVAWLDGKVEAIRHAGAVLKDLPPAKDVRVGDEVKFFPRYGPPVMGFVTASARQDGADVVFLVLADGCGTVVRPSAPMVDEQV